MDIAVRVVAVVLIVAVVALGRFDHRDLLVPGLILLVAAWGASAAGNLDLANLFGFIAFSLLVATLLAALGSLLRGSRDQADTEAPRDETPDHRRPSR